MLVSAQLRWTVWVSVVTAAYYYIQTQHGEGEVGISETVAAAAGALSHCLKWLQAASNC